MRKKHLDIVFFVIGTSLVISAAFITLLIVPRYDISINANEREVSELNVKLEQLSSSWNDYINYGALDSSNVNMKHLLIAINVTSNIDMQQVYDIEGLLTTLDNKILGYRRSSLFALSRYFDVDDAVREEWHQTWNSANLAAINEENRRFHYFSSG